MEKTGLSIEFEWRKVSDLPRVIIDYLEWKIHFFMIHSLLSVVSYESYHFLNNYITYFLFYELYV
jgi:hypothetical protein